MPPTLQRLKRPTLITLVVLALVLLFAWLVDWPLLLATLGELHWPTLLLALLFLLAGALALSLRWRYLLGNRPAFRPTFYTDSIALMANVAIHLPAPATRVIAIERVSKVTLPAATSGMIVDRLLEQIMRLTTLLLTLMLAVAGPGNATTSLMQGGAVVVVTLLVIFLLVRYAGRIVPPIARALGRLPHLDEARVRQILTDLLAGLATSASPQQLVVGLLLSLVAWGCFFVFHLQTLLALSTILSPAETAGLAMLALAVAPPSAPAMAGIYHGVLIGALVVARPGEATAMTAYALVLHALMLVMWLALGLFALTRVNLRFGELLRAVRRPAGASQDSAS